MGFKLYYMDSPQAPSFPVLHPEVILDSFGCASLINCFPEQRIMEEGGK